MGFMRLGGYSYLYGNDWVGQEIGARGQRTNWEAAGLNVYADEMRTVLARHKDRPLVFGDDIITTPPDVVRGPPGPAGPPGPPGPAGPPGPGADIAGGSISDTVVRIDRQMVPCVVNDKIDVDTTSPGATGGEIGFASYNLTLYIDGVFTTLSSYDPRDANDNNITRDVVGIQLQIDQDEVIPPGTWTMCCVITRVNLTTTVVQASGGQLSNVFTEFSIADQAYFIQVPVWL